MEDEVIDLVVRCQQDVVVVLDGELQRRQDPEGAQLEALSGRGAAPAHRSEQHQHGDRYR